MLHGAECGLRAAVWCEVCLSQGLLESLCLSLHTVVQTLSKRCRAQSASWHVRGVPLARAPKIALPKPTYGCPGAKQTFKGSMSNGSCENCPLQGLHKSKPAYGCPGPKQAVQQDAECQLAHARCATHKAPLETLCLVLHVLVLKYPSGFIRDLLSEFVFHVA